jgi:hydrogenase maturation protein HypF
MKIGCVIAFTSNEIQMFYKMWQKGLNAPFTSSIGRLFDAVASFADILQVQSFEGETGLLIQQYYDETIIEHYSYKIIDEQIDISNMIKEIILDSNKKLICSKFINMLVQIILELSDIYKNLPVVLSGGVFQNRVLLKILIEKFHKQGREFYFSKDVPLNDEGISVGQIYHKI